MRKNLDDYHFLEVYFTCSYNERLTKQIQSETNIHVDPEDMLLPLKLNAEQKHAFDLILDSIFNSKSPAFFLLMGQAEQVKLSCIEQFLQFFVRKDTWQLQLSHLVSQHPFSLVVGLRTSCLRFF